jgi:hypothetical protein
MVNLKNITDLPVAESAEGLNLIVNDNGAAKQIAASAVGAQADWAEMDETSPAFIKSKPVEEWDLDVAITVSWNEDSGSFVCSEVVNSINYDTLKNKIVEGVQPKTKVALTEQIGDSVDAPMANSIYHTAMAAVPANALGDGSPDGIILFVECMSCPVQLLFCSDGTTINMGNM